MRMLIVGIVVAACGAVTGAASHASLAGLTDVLQDEALALDTARAIDLEQRALAASEEGRAQRFAMEGRDEEARRLAASARERYGAILQAYRLILERYPDNAKANNYFGDALFDFVGDEAKAVVYWTKATERDPEFAPPWISLGNHYTHAGQYAEGLKTFERGIAADPESPEGYFHLVQAYLIYWPDLGKLLNKTGPELFTEALAMSEKATTLAPNDFELARDYAMNFFAGERMNATVDWDAAAKAWARVRAIAATEDMRFQSHLYEARAYIKAGKLDAAEAALEAALQVLPSSEVAQDLLKKVRDSRADAAAP